MSQSHDARAQVQLNSADTREKVVVTADTANHWQEGQGSSRRDVWLLQGHCTISQGQGKAGCQPIRLHFEPGALVRREPMISGVVESTRLTTQLSVSVPSMGRRSS
jgi:hypothetical protein